MKFTRCRQKLICVLQVLLAFFISIFLVLHSRDETPVQYEGVSKENEKVRVSRPWFFENGVVRPRLKSIESLKLWPSEARHDRIVNQLMFVPKEKPRSIKKIHFEKSRNVKFQQGSQIFDELNCPVKSCEIVFNETIADAIIFENHVARVRSKVSFDQVWILYSLESPYYSGQVIQQTSVNWTASYRLDSDLVTPYDKWVYYDENQKVKALRKNYAAGKTKKVAWLVSNCHSKNKRLEYAKILSKYISVDIYGMCGDKICSKDFDRDCRSFISENYKFYLSFENANCRDYITEKFYSNALRLDVIPIVMGPPREDYEKVAPHKSFIHVEDFPSPKHLAQYLHYLDKNDKEYNAYFSWKEAGEFINTYFLCRLCAMLHSDRENHFYKKITHWWRATNICTKTFWNAKTRRKILSYLRKSTSWLK